MDLFKSSRMMMASAITRKSWSCWIQWQTCPKNQWIQVILGAGSEPLKLAGSRWKAPGGICVEEVSRTGWVTFLLSSAYVALYDLHLANLPHDDLASLSTAELCSCLKLYKNLGVLPQCGVLKNSCLCFSRVTSLMLLLGQSNRTWQDQAAGPH